jgi:hypothetical protein
MACIWIALTIICLVVAQSDLDLAPLAVAPQLINTPTIGGAGHLSWDEMFTVCKYNVVNGLPSDDVQTSWMSEQRRRKEKLDIIGFAWNDTCVAESAEGAECAHQVRAVL